MSVMAPESATAGVRHASRKGVRSLPGTRPRAQANSIEAARRGVVRPGTGRRGAGWAQGGAARGGRAARGSAARHENH